ncbi:hypothetical protein N0V82_007398 [Gnomoniopsis sp. IMI 355080]|nr:hypothetical protein N0V82_007398 [Gnomoniopsis sp. IMI 355080]
MCARAAHSKTAKKTVKGAAAADAGANAAAGNGTADASDTAAAGKKGAKGAAANAVADALRMVPMQTLLMPRQPRRPLRALPTLIPEPMQQLQTVHPTLEAASFQRRWRL